MPSLVRPDAAAIPGEPFGDLITAPRGVIRHITFAPYHVNTMFGAPAGDFCHGLLHPDLMGPNRPGLKGFRDLPIGIDALYLGGAGCHGGPGITFIPGYNAAYQMLDDLS